MDLNESQRIQSKSIARLIQTTWIQLNQSKLS